MKFGRFKAPFGKRKGKSNDACRRLPEPMSNVLKQQNFVIRSPLTYIGYLSMTTIVYVVAQKLCKVFIILSSEPHFQTET